MLGNVTALDGLHATGKHRAHNLSTKARDSVTNGACGVQDVKGVPCVLLHVYFNITHRTLLDYESPYRGTSLMRKRTPLGPYSRTMPRGLWWS